MAISPNDIERALWVATACAALAAVAFTYAVYRLHRYVITRTGMRLLAALLTLLLSGCVYAACDALLLGVAYFQLYEADPLAVMSGNVFGHPGWLRKLIPVVAMAGTWAVCLTRERQNQRNHRDERRDSGRNERRE